MTLQNLLSENEIAIIFDALEKRETFWKSVGNRPVLGYGSATEIQKKKDALNKAEEIAQLQSKLVEITI